MSFFSGLVKSVKKIVKQAAPLITTAAPFIPALAPLAPFSLANVATNAITGRLPGPLQKIATPLLSGVSKRIFGGSTVSMGPQASPVSMPGGASLVSGRNAAAARRRRGTTFGRITGQQPDLSDYIRTQGSIATGPRDPRSIAPVSRESLGYPTRDIIAVPGGGSRLPPGVRGVKAMSTLPAIMRAAPGVIRTVTGKISRIVTPEGRSFSRKQVVSFAKRFGPEAAAAALGVTVADVLSGILDDSTTRRRRRGITPRDLQTTRRTICKVKNMHKMISGTPVRRRTCK